jgi:hypothetical protein
VTRFVKIIFIIWSKYIISTRGSASRTHNTVIISSIEKKHHHHQGQNSRSGATGFLRRFCQICLELDHQIFTSLAFTFFLFCRESEREREREREVVSLASTPPPHQPGGPGLCIYVPHWQGGPIIPADTGFPFGRLLGLAELRWRYSIRLQTGYWKEYRVKISRSSSG